MRYPRTDRLIFAQTPARSRGIAIAAVAMAMLFLGMILVPLFSPQPALAEAAEASAAHPALETWYVPAQHVNQAIEIEAHIQAF